MATSRGMLLLLVVAVVAVLRGVYGVESWSAYLEQPCCSTMMGHKIRHHKGWFFFILSFRLMGKLCAKIIFPLNVF